MSKRTPVSAAFRKNSKKVNPSRPQSGGVRKAQRAGYARAMYGKKSRKGLRQIDNLRPIRAAGPVRTPFGRVHLRGGRDTSVLIGKKVNYVTTRDDDFPKSQTANVRGGTKWNEYEFILKLLPDTEADNVGTAVSVVLDELKETRKNPDSFADKDLRNAEKTSEPHWGWVTPDTKKEILALKLSPNGQRAAAVIMALAIWPEQQRMAALPEFRHALRAVANGNRTLKQALDSIPQTETVDKARKVFEAKDEDKLIDEDWSESSDEEGKSSKEIMKMQKTKKANEPDTMLEWQYRTNTKQGKQKMLKRFPGERKMFKRFDEKQETLKKRLLSPQNPQKNPLNPRKKRNGM